LKKNLKAISQKGRVFEPDGKIGSSLPCQKDSTTSNSFKLKKKFNRRKGKRASIQRRRSRK